MNDSALDCPVISSHDFRSYGCPSCGGFAGNTWLEGNTSWVWFCDTCSKSCLIIEGRRSSIPVTDKNGQDNYPECQGHPLAP